jgi:polysaccharide export outer membrane protein
MRFVCIALLLCTVAGSAAPGLHAQSSGQPPDPAGLQLTRAELEELLGRYEQTAASNAYSGQLRERARTEAVLIRSRLEEGDLRVGDRIALVVERHAELADTFNVVAGRMIVLPEIGSIALAGVLRSELQSHLAAEIGRFIRDPVVHARSLVRIEILGSVGSPGFYTIPSDLLISDALMLAGGPQGSANIEKTRIERGGDVIWEGKDLREAVIEGRTLDQLSVRAGDSLIVPQQSSRWAQFRNAVVVVSGLTSILVIAQRLGLF